MQEAAPNAEFILWGPEDLAGARIHASDESVDPSEIERMILAQAFLLQRLAGDVAMRPKLRMAKSPGTDDVRLLGQPHCQLGSYAPAELLAGDGPLSTELGLRLGAGGNGVMPGFPADRIG